MHGVGAAPGNPAAARAAVAYALPAAAGAGQQRRLRLDLHPDVFGEDLEAPMLLAVAASACSGLEELDIDSSGAEIAISSWLLPLGSSLRRLCIGDQTCTAVAGSLDFLTALQDLELALNADHVVFEDDARLPLSITRLALGNGDDLPDMPPQVQAALSL